MPMHADLSILRDLPLLDGERHTIMDALNRNGWRRMATARELGIDKNTLRRKMKRLNIVGEGPGSGNEENVLP